jgi:osmoprotectant transport system ATP-binding protein
MLLALVGLPPELYRGRYPRQLSGGQRQRVGVARALAADPPVLLMDEPFGALDPITRLALQDEFLGILRSLRKTVVLVTHDIDEAIRLGDRIALMKDGRLLQYDTPDRLLARPVDAFTAAFVGADRALKRLSLVPAAATAGPAAPGAAPTLSGALSLKDALSHMLALGVERVHVADEAGQVSGSLSIRAIRRRASAADQAD